MSVEETSQVLEESLTSWFKAEEQQYEDHNESDLYPWLPDTDTKRKWQTSLWIWITEKEKENLENSSQT